MITEIQKGISILRPRARIIKTIGEELISNDIVAILELVKNSYDANASIITIKFIGDVTEEKKGKRNSYTLKKENASIIIEDDGLGMSLETIKTAWMEPATINKKVKKKSFGNKRRYTGEKGVGRFASAKLSEELILITKVESDNEIVASFDWDSFSDDKYLDEVKCSWEVRKPESIKNNGTILKLENLKTDWSQDKVKTLRIALSRLVNPISPVPDFLMELQLPKGLEHFSGDIESPDSLKKSVYSIEGFVNENDLLLCEYNSIDLEESIKINIDLNSELRPKRNNNTGKFSFKFYVWDRDNESLKEHANHVGSTVKEIKSDLDALSGISIYRDNFRVLPYGEPKNDWLRLDLRRVQNPTLRTSNNQLIGYISLSLDENAEFKDQSNREGLVESKSFIDLQEIVKIILNELEQRRYKERRQEEKEPEKINLFSDFSITNHFDKVVTKYPNDKDVSTAIKIADASVKKGIVKIQQVLSRYRRLSTLGLLVDAVLHDGNNYLGLINGDIALLKKELKKDELDRENLIIKADNIENHRKMVAELFKRLEPFGGRKRGRPKEIIIEEAISNVFKLHETQLNSLNVQVAIPNSKNHVTIDDGEFQSIIINLLINSIYWLEKKENERKIAVSVETNDNSLSIIFSDNGPGISEDNYKLVFDPYFSTKPSGIGLGLTIIGELIGDYNGDFLLIDNGPLDGATFKITFRKRI